MLPGFSTPVKNFRLLNQSNIDYNILHSIAQGRYKYVHDTQSYFIIQKETYTKYVGTNAKSSEQGKMTRITISYLLTVGL